MNSEFVDLMKELANYLEHRLYTTSTTDPTIKYYNGYRPSPFLDELRALSVIRHGQRLRQLKQSTGIPDTYDCRELGLGTPIKDQGSCGSCWDFSGTEVVEGALIKAGAFDNSGKITLSCQYTLDCGRNGGCNGDDNVTVLAWAKKTGLPTDQDYGPYNARAGRCSLKSDSKMYKIDDWGFCTTTDNSGVAKTEDIQNAMMQYGPIGCAIAADSAFSNNPSGTIFTGSGSRSIDHDVILEGWNNPGGYWILRNSWGGSWCENGRIRIKYGANLVGTEAVWAVATSDSPFNFYVSPPPVTLEENQLVDLVKSLNKNFDLTPIVRAAFNMFGSCKCN